MTRPRPLALIILDGFGLRDQEKGNAIKNAELPVLDRLFTEYPTTKIQASGEAVGLPEGQMGNSEVGHLNLGAGRVVYQEFTRISQAVRDDSLSRNETLLKVVEVVKDNQSALHLLGLVSPGGVHSHTDHLIGLLKMARDHGLKKVYLHAILDGRDTPPKSARDYLEELSREIARIGVGELATISGRYYAMDRDNRWERTKKAYDALVLGQGQRAVDPIRAVEESYREGVSDEFVVPVVLERNDRPVATVENGDALIFFNFRADRARQITRALALEKFDQFEREGIDPGQLFFVCLTEYDEDFDLPVAFPPLKIENGFGEVISKSGLRQLRIAETEKYAHVTFFFNGGEEKVFPGEERKLIPSPKVATYDLKPEMSIYEVTDALLELIAAERYDVIILNYANPDMVGHTGNLRATVRAVEAVDQCLGRVVEAVLQKEGQILLTADHGNSEQMADERGEPFTAHTTNDVPLIYIGGPAETDLKPGILADIAPTMLNILGIKTPEEMTGKVLLSEILTTT